MLSQTEACKELVERFEKPLFGFILSYAPFSREQAFDIAVVSFAGTLKDAGSIGGDGPFLEALFRRALKECMRATPVGADMSVTSDFPPAQKESLKIVREALVHLAPEDRSVVLFRDQCHFAFDRISRILDVAPRDVKTACSSARERLRAYVQSILEKKRANF